MLTTKLMRGGAIPKRSLLPLMFAAALFLFFGITVVVQPSFPLLGDLSGWMYSGALFARHLQSLPDPHHTFRHYPVPNAFLTVLLGLLTAGFGALAAEKITLCFYFAVCFAAIRSLSGALKTSQNIWWIAPGFFLAVNLWWGFFAFQFGLAELMFFTAILVRDLESGRTSRRSKWCLAFLLLLLFFTHVVPFTFACVLLFFYAMQTQRLSLLRLLAIPCVLLLSYGIGRGLAGNVETSEQPPNTPVTLVFLSEYKVNTFVKSFGFPNPVSGDSSLSVRLLGSHMFVALFLLNLIVTAAIAVIYVRGALLRDGPQRYSFAWLSAAVALPVYLVAPHSLLGMSDPGSRIMQTVLWLSLFFCMREGKGLQRLQTVAAAGAVCLALANAVLFTRVPWQAWPQGPTTLPAAVEGLAKAQHAYGLFFLWPLEQQNWDVATFSTGVFVNQGVLRPWEQPSKTKDPKTSEEHGLTSH